MGITGLLPIFTPSLIKKTIVEFKNTRWGIDGHSWLYQIAPHIAEELFYNIPSTKLVTLFESKLRLLKKYKITPVFVFDGHALSSKAHTNELRKMQKDKIRLKVHECLRSNMTGQAKHYMRQCISISDAMLYDVINLLKKENVEYLIAPYESDAQLCYLQKIKYIDYIQTEDSDLIVYGCTNILYKFRDYSLLLYNAQMLKTVKDGCFANKLKEICILSGCDYLRSIEKVGLMTAHKMMVKHDGCYKKVVEELKTKRDVPENYLSEFDRALLTFSEQVVYDPINKRRVFLSENMEREYLEQYEFLGNVNLEYPIEFAKGFHLKSDKGPIDLFVNKQEIHANVKKNCNKACLMSQTKVETKINNSKKKKIIVVDENLHSPYINNK